MRSITPRLGILVLLLGSTLIFLLEVKKIDFTVFDAPIPTPPPIKIKTVKRSIWLPISDTLPEAPKSIWIEKEKEHFLKLLEDTQTEVFIAPIQVKGSGFDRSTRSLMAGELSAVLASNFNLHSLNSQVVDRAFGEGLRKIAITEIMSMATSRGALKLVAVEVGHDEKPNLNISIQWAERNSAQSKWSEYKFKKLSFPLAPTDTAAEVFRTEAIPRIASEMGLLANSSELNKLSTELTNIPSGIDDAIATAALSPINESMIYQFLGMLAPEQPERIRERLFEQSLIAIQGVKVDPSIERILRSRANYYLHSRPAALSILSKPIESAEQAFYAFLNGNLPEMEKAVPTVSNKLLRLMLEFELHDLGKIYQTTKKDVSPVFISAQIKAFPEWQPLFERRLQELDPWYVQSNVHLKQLLDHTMAIKGFDIENKVKGLVTINENVDELVLGLSTLEHVQRIRESDPTIRDCRPGVSSCVKFAYLDLLEAATIANAVKAIEKKGLIQGSYVAAEKLGESVESFLGGNAEYSLVMAKILAANQENLAPEAKEISLLKEKQFRVIASYWEQGQSKTSADATTPEYFKGDSRVYLGIYAEDIPTRYYWPDKIWYGLHTSNSRELVMEGVFQRFLSKLKFTNSDIEVALGLAKYDAISKSELSELKSEVENRFIGHPKRDELLQAVSGENKTPDSEIAELKAAIAARPDVWDNYYNYGKYLIETQGNYVEANKIFLQFPGFKNMAGHNAVALSNYAYDAGSRLYWNGATEEARPLLSIAANLKTGSAAGMGADIKLDILDRHFKEAAGKFLARASRYPSGYFYGQYLGWLFVFGENQNAWAGFNQLQTRLNSRELASHELWRAADTGKRIEQRSWLDIKEWLLTNPIKNTAIDKQKPVLILAVLLNAIDRMPAEDLVNVMKLIEGVPLAEIDETYLFTVPDESGKIVSDPSTFNIRKNIDVKPGKISSHLIMFADAYTSLRKKDYESAAAKFYKMELFYPIVGGDLASTYSYGLSYFAWASAKSGDKFKVEAFLDNKRIGPIEGFDYHLAKAIFLGLRNEEADSIAHLKSAFNLYNELQILMTVRPIYIEYQWAETCEWLYEATKNTKYRDMALNWAKTQQKIAPLSAWAYAMEAKLSMSEQDQLRALGAALYLDPLSERAAEFPAKFRQKAKEMFELNNIFKDTKMVRDQ